MCQSDGERLMVEEGIINNVYESHGESKTTPPCMSRYLPPQTFSPLCLCLHRGGPIAQPVQCVRRQIFPYPSQPTTDLIDVLGGSRGCQSQRARRASSNEGQYRYRASRRAQCRQRGLRMTVSLERPSPIKRNILLTKFLVRLIRSS